MFVPRSNLANKGSNTFLYKLLEKLQGETTQFSSVWWAPLSSTNELSAGESVPGPVTDMVRVKLTDGA